MPDTYTGDSSATQSPAPTPGPESTIQVVLPVDGDTLNASSVEQPFKALADFNEWERLRQPDSADWDQPVHVWNDAKLQPRMFIDHFGHIRGQQIRFCEDWLAGPQNPVTTGIGQFGGTKFVYEAQQVLGGSIGVLGADGNPTPPQFTQNDWTSRALLSTGASAGPTFDAMLLESGFTITCIQPGQVVSCWWEQTMHRTVQSGGMGIVIGSLQGLASGSSISTLNPFGAYFTNDGGSVWKCNARAAYAGVVSSTSTAVSSASSDVRRRFGLDIIGGTAGDDSSARVLFWIDGNLVRNATVDLISGGSILGPVRIFFRNQGNSLSNWAIGPVEFAAYKWPAGVLL